MDGKPTARITDIWQQFLSELSAGCPEGEARAVASEVFDRMFGLPPDQRVLKAREAFPPELLPLVRPVLDRLGSGMPVQYVTGFARFGDLDLAVAPGVLIPRPETEELVAWVIEKLRPAVAGQGTENPAVCHLLDAGTGSGCIAIALGRGLEGTRVTACDISPRALELARENARRLQADIRFVLLDLLDESPGWAPDPPLDVLVSNPPYVRDSEKGDMQHRVLGFEPPEALFVPDEDPLLYYRAIARHGMNWLGPGGRLFLEINEGLGGDTVRLLKAFGYGGIVLKKDFRLRDRFICAVRP